MASRSEALPACTSLHQHPHTDVWRAVAMTAILTAASSRFPARISRCPLEFASHDDRFPDLNPPTLRVAGHGLVHCQFCREPRQRARQGNGTGCGIDAAPEVLSNTYLSITSHPVTGGFRPTWIFGGPARLSSSKPRTHGE